MKIFCNILLNIKRISTDERRLKQIILNILTNAVKFTMIGSITIKFRKEENKILISIKDTGLGIKKENMGKLFTEFCTIHEHISFNPNGTGLGLFLSKKLIKLMNGNITVESVYGKGTEFTIQIPAEESDLKLKNKLKKLENFSLTGDELIKKENISIIEESSQKISKLDILGTNMENINILIVDDDSMSAFIMTEIIQRLSFKSDHASNGKQAVDLVKLSSESKKFYSIIFMDINMPIMSGLEVLYL